jgi:hypothetical protein
MIEEYRVGKKLRTAARTSPMNGAPRTTATDRITATVSHSADWFGLAFSSFDMRNIG